MRAHPGFACRDIAQHRVERAAGLPLMEGIDPHLHAIDRQKLIAHLVDEVHVANRRLGINAKRRQLFEDP